MGSNRLRVGGTSRAIPTPGYSSVSEPLVPNLPKDRQIPDYWSTLVRPARGARGRRDVGGDRDGLGDHEAECTRLYRRQIENQEKHATAFQDTAREQAAIDGRDFQ